MSAIAEIADGEQETGDQAASLDTAGASPEATPKEATPKMETVEEGAGPETAVDAGAVDTAGGNERQNGEGEAQTKKKEKKRRKVRVKARIHTRWRLKHDPESSGDAELTNEFLIRRARFKLLWEPEKWLLAVIQVGEFHKMDSPRNLLRDAYLHFSLLQYLEVRCGYFKKPFSRLALRSSGKLRAAERGMGDDLILDKLYYGGRDIGIQLSGRIVPAIKLDYTLGFFNGMGITEGDWDADDAKDIVARVTVNPLSWLGLGINGSFKFMTIYKIPVGELERVKVDQRVWAVGGDAVMKLLGFRLHLEGIVAEMHNADLSFGNRRELGNDEYPLVLSLFGILSYKHRFDTHFKFAVEPVFKMEMLDPDTEIVKDEILMYSPGFNSYFGKYFRLMIHGEFRRPFRNARTLIPRRETLYVQLCFDI
jgi:hypothetical protein